MSRTSIPKVFMAGGAVGLTYYLYMRQYWFPNPAETGKTTGVQNIEARYTAGGGSTNHQPGIATKAGEPHNTDSRQMGESKGPDSKYFDENINEQKGESGVWPEKFYKTQYDNPRGK